MMGLCLCLIGVMLIPSSAAIAQDEHEPIVPVSICKDFHQRFYPLWIDPLQKHAEFIYVALKRHSIPSFIH